MAEGRKVEDEDRLWQQYVSVYPIMTEENFVTFENFKKGNFGKKLSTQTKDEILLEVKGIINLTV